jgi:FlgN protein.
MWQELIQVLDKLIQNYAQLLDLNKKKRAILIQVDFKALDAILQQENKLIAQVAANEAIRKTVLQKLSEGQPEIKADTKMQEISFYCPQGKEEELQQCHAKLSALVRHAAEASDANRLLVSAALSAVNYQLNVLGNTKVTPLYGANGTEQISKNKKFDFEA